MEICQFKVYIQKDSLVNSFIDKMAEWLRQWTLKQLRSSRVFSNPNFAIFYIGSMVKWIAICSLNSAINPSSNLGKKWYLENLSHHIL